VPGPDTSIAAKDVLVLYGRSARVSDLDDRRSGPVGDVEHEQARADQERVSRAEAKDADETDTFDSPRSRAA
jgi:hypothetical protein